MDCIFSPYLRAVGVHCSVKAKKLGATGSTSALQYGEIHARTGTASGTHP